ncbi:MAG: hypothetical protein ABII06_20530 [Pseudomonadota bacterium]
MPDAVIIFSVDKIRGGITKKILERNGFQVLLLNKILGLKDRIDGHAAATVIFDTVHCFEEEVRHLKNLYGALNSRTVILLGDPTLTEGFRGRGESRGLRLSDPLDPERILLKVKESFLPSNKGARNSRMGVLEDELKDFLKLQ